MQWTRYTKTICDHEETKGTTKKPCTWSWGCWPSTLLSILCFLFFYNNTVFSWKRVLLFIFQCLPFFLLGFFCFSFFTLSLYLVSCFLFPCFLVYYLLSLFFFVISCLVSLRLFDGKSIWKASFHQLFLFFGFSCFALSFKSLFF